MEGPIRCVMIAGLLAGCGNDTSMPDVDAAAGNGGLVVAWSSVPDTWPSSAGDGVTLERATFAVDSLRIVGDAAPGDPRTAAGSFTLGWDDAIAPANIGFPDAPSGVYSQLSLVIDGHVAEPSVEIRGHARVNDVDYEYRITDDSPVSLTLPLEILLTPPATKMLKVEVDFDHAMEGVDFASLEVDGDHLELDTNDPGMAAFRVKLLESFRIVN